MFKQSKVELVIDLKIAKMRSCTADVMD